MYIFLPLLLKFYLFLAKCLLHQLVLNMSYCRLCVSGKLYIHLFFFRFVFQFGIVMYMRCHEYLFSFNRVLYFGVSSIQDISFFDREAVGDLTSRLGADCQKLSHVIGNDVHLISRNALQVAVLSKYFILSLNWPSVVGSILQLNFCVQGTGALINLMTLSWPLALSALVICFILSMIFLFYGQ